MGTEQEQKLAQKPLKNNTMEDAREVLRWMKIAMSDLALVCYWINYWIISLLTVHDEWNMLPTSCYYLVNCEWGSWEISLCSKSCGGGKKTKIRSKTVTEKYNGKCEGSSREEEACNEQHCPGKR